MVARLIWRQREGNNLDRGGRGSSRSGGICGRLVDTGRGNSVGNSGGYLPGVLATNVVAEDGREGADLTGPALDILDCYTLGVPLAGVC